MQVSGMFATYQELLKAQAALFQPLAVGLHCI
jgi:hypothetical protein